MHPVYRRHSPPNHRMWPLPALCLHLACVQYSPLHFGFPQMDAERNFPFSSSPVRVRSVFVRGRTGKMISAVCYSDDTGSATYIISKQFLNSCGNSRDVSHCRFGRQTLVPLSLSLLPLLDDLRPVLVLLLGINVLLLIKFLEIILRLFFWGENKVSHP